TADLIALLSAADGARRAEAGTATTRKATRTIATLAVTASRLPGRQDGSPDFGRAVALEAPLRDEPARERGARQGERALAPLLLRAAERRPPADAPALARRRRAAHRGRRRRGPRRRDRRLAQRPHDLALGAPHPVHRARRAALVDLL